MEMDNVSNMKSKMKYSNRILISCVIGALSAFSFSVLADTPNTSNGSSGSNGSNGSNAAGSVSSKPKSLPYFNKIIAKGIGNLYITQGKEQNLSVKTDAAFLPLISATVDNDTLYLDFKGAEEHSQAEINYYLTIKDIQSIKSLTSSTIFIEEGIETDELILEIMSFGEMNVKILVKKLTANIQGAGKIKAHGTSIQQNINIIGTGEYIGTDLKGEIGNINIQGTGVATVNINKTLKITIPQEGTVRYCGTPEVSKEVSSKAIIEVAPGNLCQ